MSASDPPKSGSDNKIRISIPWKFFVIVIVAISGGGLGFSADTLINGKEKQPEYFIRSSADHKVEHEKLDKIDAGLNKQLKKTTDKLDKIIEGQRGATARREARYITKDIVPRAKREREHDRLLLLNIKRLKRGDEACRNLNCSN